MAQSVLENYEAAERAKADAKQREQVRLAEEQAAQERQRKDELEAERALNEQKLREEEQRIAAEQARIASQGQATASQNRSDPLTQLAEDQYEAEPLPAKGDYSGLTDMAGWLDLFGWSAFENLIHVL
ncbi:MAG: hypothetical protein R3C18_25925 [Planctomycetaceae bacterium]